MTSLGPTGWGASARRGSRTSSTCQRTSQAERSQRPAGGSWQAGATFEGNHGDPNPVGQWRPRPVLFIRWLDLTGSFFEQPFLRLLTGSLRPKGQTEWLPLGPNLGLPGAMWRLSSFPSSAKGRELFSKGAQTLGCHVFLPVSFQKRTRKPQGNHLECPTLSKSWQSLPL